MERKRERGRARERMKNTTSGRETEYGIDRGKKRMLRDRIKECGTKEVICSSIKGGPESYQKYGTESAKARERAP